MTAEKIEYCTFNVTFRDTDHFNKVIKWLNNNVGSGKDCWTINGKVLLHLRRSKQVTRKVSVFVEGFDPSSAVYLSLI